MKNKILFLTLGASLDTKARLHAGNIRVDQNHLDLGLPQGTDCLQGWHPLFHMWVCEKAEVAKKAKSFKREKQQQIIKTTSQIKLGRHDYNFS